MRRTLIRKLNNNKMREFSNGQIEVIRATMETPYLESDILGLLVSMRKSRLLEYNPIKKRQSLQSLLYRLPTKVIH